MEILRYQNQGETAQAAAFELSKEIINTDTPVLLLVSGGTAFEVLGYVNPEALSSQLTISTLDERFSTDPRANNFNQLQGLEVFEKATDAGVNFIPTQVVTGEALEDFANIIESGLKNWVTQNPNGKIFATLGMGTDGHTAGISPMPEDPATFNQLFNGSNWVVGYDTKGKLKYPERVTVTNTFLTTKIDFAVAYVIGENKKQALDNTLNELSLTEIPARVWNQMKQVKVFTDIN